MNPFFSQFQALLLKNAKSLKPLTLILMVMLPVLMLIASDKIVQSIQKPPLKVGTYSVGISEFLASSDDHHVIDGFNICHKKDDGILDSIMESLKKELSPYDKVSFTSHPVLSDCIKEISKFYEKVDKRFFNVILQGENVGDGDLRIKLLSSNCIFRSGDRFISSLEFSLRLALLKYEKRPGNPSDITLNINSFDLSEDFKGPNRKPYELREWEVSIFKLTLMTLLVFGSLPFLFYPMFLVVGEKRSNLMNLMRHMNLNEGLYWFSMYLVMGVVSLICALFCSIFLIYSGHLSKSWYFEFGQSLGFLTIGFMQVVAFGCFIASFCRRAAIVNSISFLLAVLFLLFPFIMIMVDREISYRGENSDVFLALPLTVPFFSFYQYFRHSITLGNPSLEIVQASYIREELNYLLWLPFVSSIIYFIAAWYCNQVFGDKDSEFQKSKLFFLSFLFRREKKSFVQGDRMAQLEVQSKMNESFLVHKLSKSYQKGKTAVKEFSGEFTPGLCYVLLGPNGSGKTSLIKMLSGTSCPTNGNAFFCGTSIKENVKSLYAQSSCCYQEDILWENLTVADHIRIFGLFRSVPNAWNGKKIDEMLDAVDLRYARNFRVSNLSGGMKRRLTFLLSIIGSPKVLFLDEPTTGLDPINRRKVWDLVMERKQGTICFLTTHSLEEAEQLGDHISILNQGKLVAAGSSIFLKNHYGLGFEIKIICKNPDVMDRIENLAKRSVFGSTVISNVSGELIIAIPKKSIRSLIKFLRVLQKIEKILAVSDPIAALESSGMEWSISDTTLEQVFLAVSRVNTEVITETKKTNADKDEVQGNICQLCLDNSADNVNLFNSSGLTIFLPELVCFQCCKEVKDEVETDIDIQKTAITADFDEPNFDMEHELSQILPELAAEKTTKKEGNEVNLQFGKRSAFHDHLVACLYKNTVFEMKKKKSNICLIIFFLGLYVSMFVLSAIMSAMDKKSYSSTESDPMEKWIQNAKSRFERSSDSSYCPTFRNVIMWSNVRGEPMLDSMLNDFREGFSNIHLLVSKSEQEIRDMQNSVKANKDNFRHTGERRYYYDHWEWNGSKETFPFPNAGGWIIKNDSDGRIVIDLFVAEANYETKFALKKPDGYDSNYDYDYGTASTQDLVERGIKHIFQRFTLRKHTIQKNYLPYYYTGIGDYNEHFVALLNVGLLTFLTSMFIHRVVDAIMVEKSENIFYMLRVSGLSALAYWTSHFLFYTGLVSVISVIAVVIIGAITWIKAGVPIEIIILACPLWSANVVAISIVVAVLAKTRRVGTFVSLFLTIVMTALAVVLSLLESNIVAYGWLSPTAFGRILYFAVIHKLTIYPALAFYMVVLAFWPIVLSAFAIGYQELSLIYGESLLDVFRAAWKRITKLILKKKEKKSNGNVMIDLEGMTKLDEDVLKEYEFIKSLTESSSLKEAQKLRKSRPVVFEALGKSYDGRKMLLEDLNFSLLSGECFALLGKNGCGKTTLLSILMGLRKATKGKSYLYGHEKAPRRYLGVCPQFDALYPDLTVEEHLKFFAKLSGFIPSHRNAAVYSSAELVGLDGDALTQKAETLSGGQKRRLSIALSTISRPKLVLLDEPTTGVDPESRLQIWKIINEIRKVKWNDGSNDATTVLLTTHSMVEAECLASRIGILSNSQLQALGTPMHLKKRFGEGCGVTLSVVPEQEGGNKSASAITEERDIVDSLRSTMASTLSIPKESIQCDSISKTRLTMDEVSATHQVAVFKYFIKFQVKVKDLNVASLFEALMLIASQEDSSMKIKEWAVSGETMENVFIKRVGSD